MTKKIKAKDTKTEGFTGHSHGSIKGTGSIISPKKSKQNIVLTGYILLASVAAYVWIDSSLYYSRYRESSELLITILLLIAFILLTGIITHKLRQRNLFKNFNTQKLTIYTSILTALFGLVIHMTPLNKIGDFIGASRYIKSEGRYLNVAKTGFILRKDDKVIEVLNSDTNQKEIVYITDSTRYIPIDLNLRMLTEDVYVKYVVDNIEDQQEAVWIKLLEPQ